MPDTAMNGYAKLKIQEVLFNSRFGQFSNLQQQQYHGARDSRSFSHQQSASEEFNLENDTGVQNGTEQGNLIASIPVLQPRACPV